MPAVPDRNLKHAKAVRMLLLATIFWGLSFPVMKALTMLQQQLQPEASGWFISSNGVTVRFGIAALIMAAWCAKTLRAITRLELWQGVGLGAFGTAGIVLQVDGLVYTSASTSAFLTQSYCLILPFIAAVRERRRPSFLIVACSLMVVAGVAILANVDWRTLKMGRGEWETLLASLMFTGQILWLERSVFARNNARHTSLVMFAGIALISLPLSLWTARGAHDWWMAYSAWPVWLFTVVLVVFCTLIAFVMMNQWQPHVSATEAGLIYAAEPVSASLYALFLPAWLSAVGSLRYGNETLTWNLLIGGGLITAANILVQMQSSNRPREQKLEVAPLAASIPRLDRE
jgi:drug/metabolite transporter (DMT)-like permease